MSNEIECIEGLRQHVRNFSKVGGRLWKMSCPVCGDSKTNPRKTRGFVYYGRHGYRYHCHKCGYDATIRTFFHDYFDDLYQELVYGQFLLRKEKKPIVTEPIEPPSKITDSDGLFDKIFLRINELPIDHPAVVYLHNRKIPQFYLDKLYYTDHFMSSTNILVNRKFKESALAYDEPRIVLPFRNTDQTLFAFAGRSLRPDSQLRYLTVKLDESMPKVYGLDSVDLSVRFYVLEGQFDSMFVSNSVAMAGISLGHEFLETHKSNAVIILDNEPRNRNVIKMLHGFIDLDYSVVIWPTWFVYKDVNDAIKGGFSISDIQRIINKRTFKGLKAKMELNAWNKS